MGYSMLIVAGCAMNCARASMIFSFWTSKSSDLSASSELLSKSIANWEQTNYPFRVYDDHDAVDALRVHGEEIIKIYEDITIPACKSDLARLALMYKFGGLYVDMHTSPGNSDALQQLVDFCGIYDLVLFDRVDSHANPGDRHIANTALGARANSLVVKKVLDRVVSNLKRQYEIEKGGKEYHHYNLAVLSGAWAYIHEVFSSSATWTVREDIADTVLIWEQNAPNKPNAVNFYKNYNYRKPGKHWSERQQSECLFGASIEQEAPDEEGVVRDD